MNGPVPFAPSALEQFFDRRRPSSKGEIPPQHSGRHHRDQIIASDELIQSLDQRAADVQRAEAFDVPRVEKQHEQPRADVLHGLAHFRHGGRFPARLLGARAPHRHTLEPVDFLRYPLIQNLDLIAREIGDRTAADGWVDIDSDVVDFSTEWRELRLILGEEEENGTGANEGEKGQRRRPQAGAAGHALTSLTDHRISIDPDPVVMSTRFPPPRTTPSRRFRWRLPSICTG